MGVGKAKALVYDEQKETGVTYKDEESKDITDILCGFYWYHRNCADSGTF